MNNNLAKLVLLLDTSRSMFPLRDTVISKYNEFIQTQFDNKYITEFDLVLFNHEMKTVVHKQREFTPQLLLTQHNYVPYGTTALNDAVGRAIVDVGNSLSSMDEKDRPFKVIFTIITDGQENASKIYSIGEVREKIEHQQSKYGWSFVYLGVGIDAFTESAKYNIPQVMTVSLSHDINGIGETFETVNYYTKTIVNSVDNNIKSYDEYKKENPTASV